MSVRGVVLTGGSSRRMGSDKAFVEVDGRAMAARVAAALASGGCDEIVCLGGDVTRLTGIGLDAVRDRVVGAGPAAAIVQAIDETDWGRTDAIVVSACDHAHLTGEAVAMLLDAVDGGRGGVAVATADGRHHLLVAIGRHAAARELAKGRATDVVSDERSVRTLLGRLEAVPVGVPAAAVRNVNRPADLRESAVPPG